MVKNKYSLFERISNIDNKKLAIFLFLIATILYLPTITFDYALDDGLVIHENKFTQQGLKGVKDIFTHDSFVGYFGEDVKYVAGGRYRPFTQFIFAIQKELFGFHPWIGHLTNILSYALLMVILFLTLKALLSFPPFNKENAKLIAFLATVLYLFHPIHTEVVCNIKSLDEIFSMLGSLGAILLLLSYHNKPKIYKLFLSGFIFFIALLSKENALTWIGVWLFWLIFTHKSFSKKYIINSFIVLLIPAALFLFIRSQVLGAFLYTDVPKELLNNPFVNSTKSQEIATVLFTWLIYFKLLIFPHPLTHDYYPKQIPILNFGDFRVWLAIIMVLAIIYILIKSWKRKPIISFAILMFIANFSMVSNLLFNVGTFMNERFIFSASAGFTLAVGWLFAKWGERSPKWAMYLLITILALYGVKTVSRSFAWKDNLTLFTTDAKISRNSSKVNAAAGESLVEVAKKTNNPLEQEKLLNDAIQYLNKATMIYPENYSAYHFLGEAYFLKKDFKKALENALICANLRPIELEPYKNVFAAGINAYLDSSYDIASMAFSFLTSKTDFLMNQFADSTYFTIQLALAYKYLNKVDSAIIILNNVLQKDTCNVEALNHLAELHSTKPGGLSNSEYYLLRGYRCDPNYAPILENLGTLNIIKRNYSQAIIYLKKVYNINPNNKNVINNLAIAYQNVGKLDSAQYYINLLK
ncbi:MAG TPA: glycosyltransferase family 39 protein [Bacteroidales bacterium]|nr:glycosyltransferase family 39 protein [Bacteroidales bacterium]HPZ36218.1 glycosyltransferase family 39 protein [Bacteroidales bacterium]